MLIVCGGVLCGMPAPEHAPAFHVQHTRAVLVVHVPSGSNQSHIGFGAHRACFQDGVFEVQGVVGENGRLPLNVFKAG